MHLAEHAPPFPPPRPALPPAGARLILTRLHFQNRSVEYVAQHCLILVEQLIERAISRVVAGNLGSGQPAAIRELIEVLASLDGCIEVCAIKGNGLDRRLST